MEIAIIACDQKKEIMTQFCTAYCGILAKHNLYATEITGRYISDATGLNVERVMAGVQGGTEQIAARVSCNEIDLVIFFCDPDDIRNQDKVNEISRLCDRYAIPFATNVATAEVLIQGLRRGDLDWRDIIRNK